MIIVISLFQIVVGTNLSYVSDFVLQENTKVLILTLLVLMLTFILKAVLIYSMYRKKIRKIVLIN